MEEYLNYDELKTIESGHLLLRDSAGNSLVMITEHLGEDKVQEEVENFKRLNFIGAKAQIETQNVNSYCASDLHVIFKHYGNVEKLAWFRVCL